MIAYRIVKVKYEQDLSGHGAELWGGRWNYPGTPIIYASEHASLALLEILAWTALPQLLKANFSLLTLKIPEQSQVKVSLDELPKDWYYPGHTTNTKQMGQEWTETNQYLMLKVPSAILPIENNILINPKHPLMKEVVISHISEISFDPRVIGNFHQSDS
jgi:RES domain-containing protein